MELIDYFGQSKGQTALVGSTLMGTHLIFGKIYMCGGYSFFHIVMVGTKVAMYFCILALLCIHLSCFGIFQAQQKPITL